jgi:hypothetical protein
MCLLVPPGCSPTALARQYFWGDSQAAPVFNVVVHVAAPLVALLGATIFSLGRRWLGFGLATTSMVVIAWPQLVTYFFVPLQPLVLGSSLLTVIALARTLWSEAQTTAFSRTVI